MKNSTVGVYIITHNRLNTLKRSLESVINQNYKDFTIVVSDNSDNDETMVAMQKYLVSNPRIKYIRQTDAPSGIEHINKVLRNNSFDFFMMFHDDDEMMPDMVGTLYQAIKDEPQVCAVVPDILINENGAYLDRRMVKCNEVKYFDAKGLTKEYTSLRSPGFPAYMYRAEKVRGVYLNPKEGGKYCDVSFLIKVAAQGSVKYIPQPLMYYFVNSEQDSATHEYSQFLLLFKFLKSHTEAKEDLTPMRLRNIYRHIEYVQKTKGRIPFKKTILYYFMRYSINNYFPKYILRLMGYGNPQIK
jgi:glycosyltransferase involved in cell wall biosynthesis